MSNLCFPRNSSLYLLFIGIGKTEKQQLFYEKKKRENKSIHGMNWPFIWINHISFVYHVEAENLCIYVQEITTKLLQQIEITQIMHMRVVCVCVCVWGLYVLSTYYYSMLWVSKRRHTNYVYCMSRTNFKCRK